MDNKQKDNLFMQGKVDVARHLVSSMLESGYYGYETNGGKALEVALNALAEVENYLRVEEE